MGSERTFSRHSLSFRKRRPILVLISMLMGAAVFSLACGSGNESQTPQSTAVTSPTSAISPTSTVTSSTSPTPSGNVGASEKRFNTGTVLDRAMPSRNPQLENVRYGGTLKELTTYSAGTIDPKFNNQNIVGATKQVYESLIIWVPNPNDILFHYEPHLAERWEISKDFKTYSFYIRKGIKFDNIAPVNGRELVANDVVLSLNRYMEPDSTWAGAYQAVDSIKEINKYTVEIKLKEPSAWAINDLFPNNQYILPAELIKEKGANIGTTFIGTGPYLIKNYTFRRGSSYVRNPDYWQKDAKGRVLPYLDAIEQTFITDAATQIAAYRTGQADSGGSFTVDEVINLATSSPSIQVSASDFPSRWGLAFNTRNAPWSDVNVRRGINMKIDKIKYVEQFAAVKGNWEITGAFPKAFFSDDPAPLSMADFGPYYQYKPDEGNQLLEKAGFPGGKMKVPSPLLYATPGYHIVRAQVLQDLFKKEGIEVTIQPADRAVYQDVYYKREQKDLAVTHQNTGDWSLNWFAQNKFQKDAFQNTSWINDPDVERTVAAIKITTDPAKLKEYAKFLWDFETLGSYNIWLPTEYSYSVNSGRLRNFPGTQGFLYIWEHQWLADAPRTSPYS